MWTIIAFFLPANSPEAVSRRPSPRITVVASNAVDALLGAPIPHGNPLMVI